MIRVRRAPLAASMPAAWIAGAASLVALASGCAGPERAARTEADLLERGRRDSEASAVAYREAIGDIIDRGLKANQGAKADGEPPTLNLLAISGGGDWGAFGAGFLVGWGEVQDPKWRRPTFDAVSGVSTGALLAPFAFIGTDESCRSVEEFYRNPKNEWVRTRGLLFFLPSNPSFMTISGLEKDIRAAVDQKLISQVAAGSRDGRALAVSATNLDLGRQRVWELGEEAQAAESSRDYDRFCRMLLASSAIPGVFPPVRIDDFLYADGGVTANVLVRLDPTRPDALLPRWKREHPNEPLPRVRYWIIFNNRMIQAPKTAQVKWPAVIGPSLEASVRHATISELRWLAAQANYVNAVWHTDIEVRVVWIPNDWRPPVEGTFQKETMRSLADLGEKMGADPHSWKVWNIEDPGEEPAGTPSPGSADAPR